MKDKLTVGILSDSPMLTTGYATIASNVANILSKEGHQVIYFASNYLGQPLMPGVKFEDNRTLDFTIIGQGQQPYFNDLLEIYCKKFKLDVLFILLDTFMLYGGDGWFLKKDTAPAKTIFYYPSDGGAGMPLQCEKILEKVDLPVAMAKFGRDQVKKIHNIDTDYIPHAVDTKNYYKLKDEERTTLKKNWGLENKFVVGVVARNQGRKMLDRTFKSFKLFANDCPEAVLLLHTDPNDNAQVFPIQTLIDRYNLQNRVLYTGTRYYQGWSYAKMNEVYNLMDCFFLSTSGEGFGVPIIEAMAAEVPVLATNYTTTKELVIDHESGLGIDLVGTTEEENPDVHGYEIIDGTLTGSWAVERGMCSIKDAAKKLKQLYDNPEERKVMGKNGRLAVLENYSWDVVGKMWIERIEKLGEII